MSRPVPSSVTIEEAVARMVNMDYIPAGLTLLDMTAAFMEEAEVEFENARIDRLPEEQILPLRLRMESCRARHALTQLLLESLQHEVKYPEGSTIEMADDGYGQSRLTLESVADWAAYKYGIGIPEWVPESLTDATLKDVRWEDVTIKIWAEYNIGYSFKQGEFRRSTFRKIGLFDERKKRANKCGLILIGLSEGRKFPAGIHPDQNEKVAMSRLRDALQKLINLPDDPIVFDRSAGWKPCFQLIDDRRASHERKKEETDKEWSRKSKKLGPEAEKLQFDKEQAEAYGEASDYLVEDDDTQKWIEQHDKK